MNRTPILVIVGPTASGKSALGLALARVLNGSIVNADSVQIHRGLDIGSAKATLVEQQEVPHHLIDIREPEEDYTAGDFVRDADEAIRLIGTRQRLPIVVGGSGLYLRSLLHGLAPELPRSATVRDALRQELDRLGPARMHEQLAAVDPRAAERIHERDTVRVLRALEVHRITGHPISAAQRAHGLAETRHRALVLAITARREDLHARIQARSQAMVRAGLLDEVRALLDSGVSPDAQSMRAIGYRHAVEVLVGGASADGLVERLARDTRRYARRQRTFFRRQLAARWLCGPMASGATARLARAVRESLSPGAALCDFVRLSPGWPDEDQALAAGPWSGEGIVSDADGAHLPAGECPPE
ncbi:MAG: tRNA (adenosine(37)-N6)-dimethylallyltransferase MiaA [Deltaproteobacteria bacterium]|nr:MAG: tRNA (adenosine(37)-N6)-dimethylallyltransferase MiaA [Deltaproteobacteria bacterium]